jgi:hypothetical protein
LQSETESPKPLSASEIKEGLIYKLSEALRDRLGKTCSLFGCSYPYFEGKITYSLRLNNYGDVTVDNGEVNLSEGTPDPEKPIEEISGEIEIAKVPPNQFRIDTEQPIVVNAVEDGKTVEKRVRYQAKRGPGRPQK